MHSTYGGCSWGNLFHEDQPVLGEFRGCLAWGTSARFGGCYITQGWPKQYKEVVIASSVSKVIYQGTIFVPLETSNCPCVKDPVIFAMVVEPLTFGRRQHLPVIRCDKVVGCAGRQHRGIRGDTLMKRGWETRVKKGKRRLGRPNIEAEK